MDERTVTIRPLSGLEEAQWCAQLMANSEPWMTLERDYEASLSIITDLNLERYILLAGDEPAGFILIAMNGALTGYIKSIVIAPAFRNQGLGTTLLTFAEERIFRDRPNAFICVSSFNPDAKKLYERQGYKVIGLLEDYIGPGHGEYLMRKSTGPIAEFQPQSALDKKG